MKPADPRIEVVEIASGKVVHTIKLGQTSERYVERVLAGLLRNLDTERFFAREILK